MARTQPYRRMSVELGALGAQNLAVTGAYIFCLAATGDFLISVDSGPKALLYAGTGFQLPAGEVFGSVALEDTSGGGNTVELAIGFGDFRDGRLTVTGALNIAKTVSVLAVGDKVIGAGAGLTILNNFADNNVVFIRNLDPTATLRLGDASTATAGVSIGPGEAFRLATRGNVALFNPAGHAVTVSLSLTRD